MATTQKDTFHNPMVHSLKHRPKHHERASGEILRPTAEYAELPFLSIRHIALDQYVHILCLHHDDHSPPLNLPTTIFSSPHSPRTPQQNTTSPSGRSVRKRSKPCPWLRSRIPQRACGSWGNCVQSYWCPSWLFRIEHGSCLLGRDARCHCSHAPMSGNGSVSPLYGVALSASFP
jgi:hypothetical protein